LVELISLIIDFIIGLGSTRTDRYLGGPKFNLSYVSGHPEFPLPDEKGRLVVARDRLKYAREDWSDAVFEIPFDLVEEARPLDPKMVELHLAAGDGSSSNLYFRGRNTREIRRFLEALRSKTSATHRQP
jgi:hypothetical protein